MTSPRLTRSYSIYASALVFTAYLFNYMDRMLVSVLTQPIKEELDLSDAQAGLLTGPAFAITYVSCGFLFAFWADRGHRPTILATAITIWSAATALCGMAGSFLQLFASRILVGFGEAGGTPTSMSLVADYFPRERRSSAYSVLFAGAPAGILIGSVLAGWVAEQYGWRWAFLLIGLPGLAVAALIFFTLREMRPPGFHEKKTEVHEAVRTPLDVFRNMGGAIRSIVRVPSARNILIATAVESLLSQGLFAWVPTFYIRYHNMSLEETGRWFGLGSGLGMLVGIILGGLIADRLVRWRLSMVLIVPIIANATCIPLYFLTFTLPGMQASLMAFVAASVVAAIPLSYTMNAYQSAVPSHVRSMAGAVTMFASAVLGIGTASVIIGLISDYIRETTGQDGLATAMLFALLPAIWAIVHYVLALKTLKEDIDHAEQSS